MKRNFTIAASLVLAFAGLSCERHRWTDKVEIKEEPAYDADGNVIGVTKTPQVVEKGAVRFFKESHKHDDHAKKPEKEVEKK